MSTPLDWLQFALDDLAAAHEDIAYGHTAPRIACFNAQQAAEKLLKGVLLQHGISFPKTHDLRALEALLPPHLQTRTVDLNLVELNDWAVQAKYPDFACIADPIDADEAVRIAEAAFAVLSEEIATNASLETSA